MTEGLDITLKLGDAMTELGKIPAGSVDMVLTDPPYGITAAAWDKRPDWSTLFPALWRALKPNGAMLIFAQMPVAAELVMLQRRYFRYEWVWHKSSPAGFLNSHRMPMRQHELVLVYYRRLPTYNAVPIASQSSTPYKTQRGATQSRLFHPSPRVTTHCPDGSRFPQDVVKYDRPANAGYLLLYRNRIGRRKMPTGFQSKTGIFDLVGPRHSGAEGFSLIRKQHPPIISGDSHHIVFFQ